MTDEALQQLEARFNSLHAKIERPSIALEKMFPPLLLLALYSVRSEHLLFGTARLQPTFR